jgi:signal transduction histidine kinase
LLRADLFTRMLVLVAVATAPAVLVLVYLQYQLHADERAQRAEDVLRQAELVSSDVASIVEAARQMTTAVSRIDQVRRLDPACAAPLAALRGALPSYVTLAVIGDDGGVICFDGLDLGGAARAGTLGHAAIAMQTGQFEIGDFMPAQGGHAAMLPFYLPFTASDGRRRGTVMAGLSLTWLAGHMMEFKRPAGSTVTIADRLGTTLLRLPDNDAFQGESLPAGALALIRAPRRGNAVVLGNDGQTRLVGYVPIDELPAGLFVSVGISLPDLNADIDRAAFHGYALIGVGALLSLWLAMLVGQRFVRRPTAALLNAAGRWSSGDLAARVDPLPDPRSEFGRLARAFNSMAEALGRQRRQWEDLNVTLEARVAERTSDLRASRDQLQVTMAEHAKSEASLRQAQKLQVVGQLAGGIAHDFNNLLTGILGALEVLRGRLPADDARSLRLVDTALLAADRGGRLTAQLLTFSRRQRLLPVPTNLNDVVDGMLDLMSSTLGRDVHVTVELDDRPGLALVDPHQVESAILNLAVNARDAMAGRGDLRIVTGRAKRSAGLTIVQSPRDRAGWPLLLDPEGIVASERAPDGDYAMIWVSDNGTGMSADTLMHVFEPFFTTKQPGQGSGLGLSQVHGLAAQSGGEVQIASRPGEGTTVTLLLPRAHGSVVPADPDALFAFGPRGLTVLVVDDDAEVLRMTGEMLAELRHTPLFARDGTAALAVLEAHDDVDLLLTDHAMPGLSGLELIAAAHRMRPGLRAVLMSGHAELDGATLDLCPTILLKPFSLAGLAAIVQEHREAARVIATTPA